MIPPDEAVRRRIVTATGVTMAVEAGAGTGKTRLLVDRVLHRLEQGVPLPRLAVVTFTKKAAAELVARIRSGVRERRGEPWAEACLADFDRAEIGTTDSFCFSVLSRHPLEAGISPGFSVADEVAQEALLETAWERFLERQGAEEARALERLRRAGGKPSTLRAVALSLIGHRDLPNPAPEDPPGERGAPDALLDEALGLAALCRDRDDLLLRHLRELELERRVVSALPGPSRARAILGRARTGKGFASRQGRADAWGGRHNKERVHAALAQVQEAVEERGRAEGARLTRDACAWAAGYAREYEQVKRERGLVDFTDLALRTRDLLRDRPAVRRRIASRYEEILMDEVQDTDPLQMEIAFLLAADGEVPADPLSAKLVPGKLFLVGDPKQSIYRFRRADIELYERAVDRVRAQGETPKITVNFRSRPSLLRFVNRVFSGWMEPTAGGAWQARYEELRPAVEADQDGPAASLLLPDPALQERLLSRQGAREVRVRERRALEIDACVRLVRHAVGADGEAAWTVRGADGSHRPAEPADVCVLVRKMDWGERLLAALQEAGVPATSSGGRLTWQREEIHTVVTLLEAIAHPEDSLARFAALRSLVFGLSDDELVLHFLEGPAEGSAAADCQERLDRLGELARTLDVPELLERVVTELCVLPVFAFRPDGAARMECLRMLIEAGEELARAGYDSLPALVEWLRARSGNRAPEGLGESDPGAEEGVRILTMHKAKGLEFPVVLLADLTAEPRRDAGVIPDRTGGTVRISVSQESGIASPGYAEARESEKGHRAAEEVRLLYVAMTRARDHLVISWPEGSGGFLADGVLAERIGAPPGRAPEAPGELGVLRAADLPPATSGAGVLRVDPDRPRVPRARENDRWEADRARALGGPRVIPATRLRESEDPFPEARGRGAAFGRWVHAALETMDATTAGDPERLVIAAGRRLGEEAPREIRADVTLFLQRIARDSAVREITDATPSLREVPFLLPAGEDLLSGALDAVVEDARGALTLVDWKTEAAGPGGAARARERFRAQALAYAWAASRLTGREVLEVRFVFLSEDPVEAAGFPVNAAFLEEARLLVDGGRERL